MDTGRQHELTLGGRRQGDGRDGYDTWRREETTGDLRRKELGDDGRRRMETVLRIWKRMGKRTGQKRTGRQRTERDTTRKYLQECGMATYESGTTNSERPSSHIVWSTAVGCHSSAPPAADARSALNTVPASTVRT